MPTLLTPEISPGPRPPIKDRGAHPQVTRQADLAQQRRPIQTTVFRTACLTVDLAEPFGLPRQIATDLPYLHPTFGFVMFHILKLAAASLLLTLSAHGGAQSLSARIIKDPGNPGDTFTLKNIAFTEFDGQNAAGDSYIELGFERDEILHFTDPSSQGFNVTVRYTYAQAISAPGQPTIRLIRDPLTGINQSSYTSSVETSTTGVCTAQYLTGDLKFNTIAAWIPTRAEGGTIVSASIEFSASGPGGLFTVVSPIDPPGPILVDDFSDPGAGFPITDTTVDVSEQNEQEALSNVIAALDARRHSYINLRSGTQASATVSNNKFNITVDPGSTASFTIAWEPGRINLTQFGANDQIRVETSGDFDSLVLSVFADGIAEAIAPVIDGVATFPLSSLLDQASSYDLERVTQINLGLPLGQNLSAGSYSINQVTVTGASQPTLHWPLEEGSGTTTEEVVTATTDVATLTGSTTWNNGFAPNSNASLSFLDTPGNSIDAGTLQTDGQYVPTALATDYDNLGQAFTMTAHIDPNEIYGGDYCIITSDTGISNWWLFGHRSRKLFFDFSSVRVFSGFEIEPDKSYFVSITTLPSAQFPGDTNVRFAAWDGAQWLISYHTRGINPVLKGLEIGAFNNATRVYDGDIDDVRLYGETLSMQDLTGLALTSSIRGDLAATISTVTPSPTNNPAPQFQIQFTEPVTGFDSADLLPIFTGSASASASPVISGSGSLYTVSVPTTGDGTVALSFDPTATITDADGDPLTTSSPSLPITTDYTEPTPTITLRGNDPTGAIKVEFDITFDEDVTNFDLTDLQLANLGLTVGSTNLTQTNPSTYLLTLDNVVGVGSYTVSFDPGHDILDTAGNGFISSESATLNHIDDITDPEVVSITPATTTPDGREVEFTVVFSEEMIGFNNSQDVTFGGTGLQAPGIYGIETTDNITFTFTFSSYVEDGLSSASSFLSMNSDNGLTDRAGRPLANPFLTSSVVTLPANPYQLWAISHGLTPDVDFESWRNPDNDNLPNYGEFLRYSDPNKDVAINERVHVVDIEGQDFAAITFPARDELEYDEDDDDSWYDVVYYGNFEVYDYILAGIDLERFGYGDTETVEDPTITTPADLPALPSGWSYRHFRFTSPTSTQPKGFFRSYFEED